MVGVRLVQEPPFKQGVLSHGSVSAHHFTVTKEDWMSITMVPVEVVIQDRYTYLLGVRKTRHNSRMSKNMCS